MGLDQLFDALKAAQSSAIDAIVCLRETAEEFSEKMEAIIESCETIENEF